MQTIMQNKEQPLRVLADININMSLSEFYDEMNKCNIREIRSYFCSSNISENLGLPRGAYIIYLNRFSASTGTMLAFTINESKNFYKKNMLNSTWGSWIVINNDQIETEIESNKPRIYSVYASDAVASTEKYQYYYKKVITDATVTENDIPIIGTTTGEYGGNFLVETGDGTITLWLVNVPSTSVKFNFSLIKGVSS